MRCLLLEPTRPPVLVTLVALGAAACGGPSAPSSEAPRASAPSAAARPSPSPEPSGERAAARRGREAMHALATRLKERLGEAIRGGGFAEGVDACASVAQDLTREVGAETGVRVGRSSLRLRNPANRGPEWVQELLEELGERKAGGLEGGIRPGGEAVRLWKPIPLDGLCVSCHGPEAALDPEVEALLDEHYPEDRARGYAPGDLRGVFWAEVPLPESP